MGWCSGTDIFDAVAKEVIDSPDIPHSNKHSILYALGLAMQRHDWDCEDDSDYREHPIVKSVFEHLNDYWDSYR